jgi:hypothetical protein
MTLALTGLVVTLEEDLRHQHEKAAARYKVNVGKQAVGTAHPNLVKLWLDALKRVKRRIHTTPLARPNRKR